MFLLGTVTKYFSQNNFPGNLFRNFPKKSFRHTRQSHGSRFSKMLHRIFRQDSCIQSPPHAADPQKTERKNSPCFHSGITQPIRQTIGHPKASINDHFRGLFIPNYGKRRAIIAYSKNRVPEFAIFCYISKKNRLPVGVAGGVLPTEK